MSQKPTKGAGGASPAAGDIVPHDAETTAFVKGLVERGEAARPNPDGTLPPGATHEIVGETESGLPILRRRRFSLH
jgi:hypothetical protein